jgi:hypothetical protein
MRLGADRAGLFAGVMPVAGYVAAVALETSPWSLAAFSGALLCGLGIALGLRAPSAGGGHHPGRSRVPGQPHISMANLFVQLFRGPGTRRARNWATRTRPSAPRDSGGDLALQERGRRRSGARTGPRGARPPRPVGAVRPRGGRRRLGPRPVRQPRFNRATPQSARGLRTPLSRRPCARELPGSRGGPGSARSLASGDGAGASCTDSGFARQRPQRWRCRRGGRNR